jgi:hypothetical protein
MMVSITPKAPMAMSIDTMPRVFPVRRDMAVTERPLR